MAYIQGGSLYMRHNLTLFQTILAMGSQDFHFKCHSHHSNVLSVFEQLMSQEQFVDVTLVCEGMNIKAHKMLLSACSPFFKGIFEENPCRHPVIVMKDVKFTELKAVVDFMYRGEIHLPKDELQNFLQTADLLKVKGLTEVRSNFQLSFSNKNQESTVNPVLHQITSSDVNGKNQTLSQPLKKRRGRRKRHSTGEEMVGVSDLATSDRSLQLGKNSRLELTHFIPKESMYPVHNTVSCATTSFSVSVTEPTCEVSFISTSGIVTSPAFSASSMVGAGSNFNHTGFALANSNPVILGAACTTVSVATPIIIAPIYTNSPVTRSGNSTPVVATTATSTVVASPIPVTISSTQLLSPPEGDWLVSHGQQNLQKHSEENIPISVTSCLPAVPDNEDVSQRVKEEPLSPQASENVTCEENGSAVAGPSGSVISEEFLSTNDKRMLPQTSIEHTIASLTCETCNKSFTRRHDLKRHSNTHSNMRVFFSCYFCSKVFSWKRSLQQHVKYHHHKL
ncbi:uncharacterized protein LOC143234312 isoform X2 [Tachypleus tridentatus]|uniref:uncharacterized protein LOC143234312 isoform X2 n=1 Tax=Tachypleus tridentatus TaxID=6853 RepID=UPI003FCFAA88